MACSKYSAKKVDSENRHLKEVLTYSLHSFSLQPEQDPHTLQCSGNNELEECS